MLRGTPKIYLEPAAPYTVEPGGNLNITCAGVAFPFPAVYWQRENEESPSSRNGGRSGTIKSEQVLMIKEIYKVCIKETNKLFYSFIGYINSWANNSQQ